MTTVRLVVARGADPLHHDLAGALAEELGGLGVTATVALGALPDPRDDVAYALVGVPEGPVGAEQLLRSVLIGTGAPGTPAYEAEVALALAGVGGVLHLLPASARAQRRLGIASDHAPPGWTSRWEAAPDGPRDLDVLSLGEASWRRRRAFARLGEELAGRRVALCFAAEETPSPGDALARARVLMHVHDESGDQLPALTVVRAICAGALVVCEHPSGTAPFAAGTHFAGVRLESLGLLVQAPLDDEDARRGHAGAALDALRAELPLSRTAALIAERATDVARPGRTIGEAGWSPAAVEDPHGGRYPSDVADEDASALRSGLKDTRLELLQLGRTLRRAELARRRGREVPAVEIVATTPAYELARPRVSVLTPVYNHAEHVVAAASSAARSRFADLEIVVVDDGSSDDSSAAVAGWMDAHPEVPALLLRHPVNRGLGPARNSALDFARGELVFPLDADNEVLPECVTRLVDALDADPDSAFAYCMLGMFEGERPVGLRSMYPWAPRRLRHGNPIDAMALLRARTVRSLGGYSTDRRMHGWEDYDLWCRTAEHGLRGTFVAQVLARYRTSQHSMLTITDLSWRVAVSLLIDRYPTVMAGVRPPL